MQQRAIVNVKWITRKAYQTSLSISEIAQTNEDKSRN